MTDRPKKSETLEVRISHQEKEAIKNKAASEGMTVSAWVRDLIAKNVKDSQKNALVPFWKNRLLIIARSPFKTIGTLMAISGSAALLTSTAQAGPISLGIEFEHATPAPAVDGSPFLRTKRMTTDLLLEENNSVCFSLDPSVFCGPGKIPEDALVWFIEPSETPDGIFVKLKLQRGNAIIAEPSLIIVQGETGGLTIGGDDGSKFSFKIIAHNS